MCYVNWRCSNLYSNKYKEYSLYLTFLNHRTNPHTPAQFSVHIKYRASPDGLRVAPVEKPAQKSTPFVCGRGGGAIAR